MNNGFSTFRIFKNNAMVIASNIRVRIGLKDIIWYKGAVTNNFNLLKLIHALREIFEKNPCS